MKESFVLRSDALTVQLRTITEADRDILRRWKNANRFNFFFQEIISPQQQSTWFMRYMKRGNDFMFVVMYEARAIGCMGFRLLEGKADIYNVILGCVELRNKGFMSQALRLMCSYIHSAFTTEILLKVMRSNPASSWYEKNGFRRVGIHEKYFDMELNPVQFHPCEFKKTTGVQLNLPQERI